MWILHQHSQRLSGVTTVGKLRKLQGEIQSFGARWVRRGRRAAGRAPRRRALLPPLACSGRGPGSRISGLAPSQCWAWGFLLGFVTTGHGHCESLLFRKTETRMQIAPRTSGPVWTSLSTLRCSVSGSRDVHTGHLSSCVSLGPQLWAPALGWGVSKGISLSHYLARMLSHFSRAQLFATPWTVAPQAPLSLGFSRQEYWSGLPFPSPNQYWKN